MESLLDHEHGLSSLIVGLVIAVGLNLLVRLFNFALQLFKTLREVDQKKLDHLARSMEENTKAINNLSGGLKVLGDRIVETDILASKQEMSHTRLIAVVKEMAGENWGPIQDKVRKDQFIADSK